MMRIALLFFLFFLINPAFSQMQPLVPILPGAYQTTQYLPLLKGKRVGLFANQTSTIGNTHLIDTLINLGINVSKVFAPEHGFRGISDAGEKIESNIDRATGIRIVSMYGKKTKPFSKEDKRPSRQIIII